MASRGITAVTAVARTLTDPHEPRLAIGLAGSQRGTPEEAVDREVERARARQAAAVEGTRTARPAQPESRAGWPRRGMRAVARLWRASGEADARLGAVHDEVRRRLFTDQPRAW